MKVAQLIKMNLNCISNKFSGGFKVGKEYFWRIYIKFNQKIINFPKISPKSRFTAIFVVGTWHQQISINYCNVIDIKKRLKQAKGRQHAKAFSTTNSFRKFTHSTNICETFYPLNIVLKVFGSISFTVRCRDSKRPFVTLCGRLFWSF